MPLGIESALRSAIESILTFIVTQMYTMMDGMINHLLIPLITSSPMPRSDSSMPPLATPYEPSACSGAYQAAAKVAECKMWGTLYHEVYMGPIMRTAVILFIMSYAAWKAAQVFSDIGADKRLKGGSAEDFVYALVGFVVWWPLATAVLFFSNIFTKALVGCTGNGCNFMAGISVEAAGLSTVIAGAFIYTVGNVAMLAVVAFWVLRYIMLVVLVVIMPIMLSLRTLSIEPLDKIGDQADDFLELFMILALAPLPAGIILMLGSTISTVTDALIQSLQLSGAQQGAALAAQYTIDSIIFIAVPIIAGAIPVLYFKDDIAGELSGAIAGEIEEVFDSLGEQTQTGYNEFKDDASTGIQTRYGQAVGTAQQRLSGEYESVRERAAVGGRSRVRSAGNALKQGGVSAGQTAAMGGAGLLYHRDAMIDGIKDGARRKAKNTKDGLVESATSAPENVKDELSQRGSNAVRGAADTVMTPYDRVTQAKQGIESRASTVKDTREEDVRKAFGAEGEIEGAADSAYEAMFNRSTVTDPSGDQHIKEGLDEGDAVEMGALDNLATLETNERGETQVSSTGTMDSATGYDPTEDSFEGEEDLSEEELKQLQSSHSTARKLVAALGNTDVSDVDNPAIRRALAQAENSEKLSSYANEMSSVDESSLANLFGTEFNGKVNTDELLSDIKNKDEKGALAEVISSVGGMSLDDFDVDDPEVESLTDLDAETLQSTVADELGEQYINGINDLMERADFEDQDLFDMYGKHDAEEIQSELQDKFGEKIQNSEAMSEAAEKLRKGQVESAKSMLSQSMFDEEQLSQTMESSLGLDSDEIEDMDSIIEGINNDNKGTVQAEIAKQLGVQAEEAAEMRKELMEKAAESQAEMLEEQLDQYADALDESAIDSLAGENSDLTEVLSNDETAQEEFDETLQNIADSKHTDFAKQVKKAMKNANPNDVDDPDIQSALTRFEGLEDSMDTELPDGDVEGADLAEVQEEIKNMSDDELESVSRAMGAGAENEINHALERLSVGESLGNTRWEDTEE